MNGSTNHPRNRDRLFSGILATGITLWIFHLAIRSHVLEFDFKPLWSPVHYLPRLLLASFYDAVFCLGLTLFFTLFLWVARRCSLKGGFVLVAFQAVAILSLVAALLDMMFMKMAGAPFSYQWLYYSDFLMSLDAHQAIQANLSWMWALWGLLLVLATVGVSFLIRHLGYLLSFKFAHVKAFAVIPVAVIATYLVIAGLYVSKHDMPAGIYDHPVLYFVQSWAGAKNAPAIFTMQTSLETSDFLPVSERIPEPSQAPRNPEIKNVILFVLESVGAQYTEPFGGKYPVTPTLNRYRDKGALFDKIHVPAPMTVNSLWSLQCSMYPWISHKLMVREHPRVQAASLSGELRHRGYQTAFLNSSDNRYQHADVFLSERDIQMIKDCRTMGPGGTTFHGSSQEHYDDGCDDRATAAALNQWIDEQQGKPFFGTLWTVMTHYPYYVSGKEVDYQTGDAAFNRYLNALRIGDEALGMVLSHLEEKGLMDSTLVVVIGDHGEAFGQHNRWNHDNIYDETIRVPVMLINPKLFHGETHSQVGSTIDIAPTILDILGTELPDQWQGSSLFSASRSNRAYFFEPLAGYWFGYREGDYVCLYNATANQYEVYDMAKDPMQKHNLAAASTDKISAATRHLGSWVQYQNAYIQKLADPAPSPARQLSVAH